MLKLGLIAGGGALPAEVADHCRRAGRDYFVIRLKGFAGPELANALFQGEKLSAFSAFTVVALT